MNRNDKITVEMDRDLKTFLALLLIFAIGVGLHIWGIVDINRINHLKDNGIDATGWVVDYEHSTDDDDDDIYYAIYEYYVDGVRYTVKDSDDSYFKPDLGEKHVVYYDPENPADAVTSLEGGVGGILLVTGWVFELAGLLFILAWFNVNEAIIRMVAGVLLILMGFGFPIVVRSILMFLFTGIFGVFGVVILVKAITKFTGNEGGVVDQALDAGLEQASEVVQNVIEETQNGASQHGATIMSVSAIIKGILTIIPGSLVLLFGAFLLLTGSIFMGVSFVAFGGLFLALGIKSIKDGMRIKREAQIIEQENEV